MDDEKSLVWTSICLKNTTKNDVFLLFINLFIYLSS